MQRYLLGFCGGALLPAAPWPPVETLPGRASGLLLAGLAAALLGHVACTRWQAQRRLEPPTGSRATVLAAALLGLAWSAWHHADALSARLRTPPEGASAVLLARVVSEPQPVAVRPEAPPALRFNARLPATQQVVRLAWYGAPGVRRGDLWRLRTVLRGPWGYANPGGFDYERWLLGAGIHGTGYVRGGTLQSRPPPGVLERVRRHLDSLLQRPGLRHGAILRALLLGRAGAVEQRHWRTFRATGTVHLMVISGLHVSLAAGLGWLIGRYGCRLCPPLLLWLDARRGGCLAAAICATGYVLLAGSGLPALRALVMTLAAVALLAGGRRPLAGGALLAALTLLLLIEPLAVHQQGFWLSFGAVALLVLVLGGRRTPDSAGGAAAAKVRAGTVLRTQLALSLGMLPLVALFTGTAPWIGAAANLLAVPVVSLVVVPLTLLGGVLAALAAPGASLAFGAADVVLSPLLRWLELLARLPLLHPAGGVPALLAAQAAALWWLLEPSRNRLPLLMLCWMLPLAPRPPGLQPGEYRVTALDVGQGTAVLVDTRRHRLLYDAGPAFPGGHEAGSAVVVPSMAATGRADLDVMILSHDDLDHTGGAAHLLRTVPVGRLLTSFPRRGAESCHGRRWRWDGVEFRLLDLPRPPQATDNDRSCVLLVDDGHRPMLLAGDIGRGVERSLLRRLAAPVHLLFAPHHGSASSSSRALVRVLRPRLVFVSAGYGNRFGHPHADVVARWRAAGARLYQTGRAGALIWRSSRPGEVVGWRRRGPWWRSQPDQVDWRAGSESRR